MDQTDHQTKTDSSSDPQPDSSMPTGDHPLEVAARNGIGPLSPRVRDVWHGHAIPCVSCGQLVARNADRCDHCDQDLTDEMIEKMRTHAGPWYVLEHVRPFPGVSLERIIRQIRRGLLTETSIVRGPSTQFQWRFAVETPGLSRYFGKCWQCHHDVTHTDPYCAACLSYLSFEKPRPIAPAPPTPTPTPAQPATTRIENDPQNSTSTISEGAPTPAPSNDATTATPPERVLSPPPPTETATPEDSDDAAANEELQQLATALRDASPAHRSTNWEQSQHVGPVNVKWIAVALLAFVVIALVAVTALRRSDPTPATSPTPIPSSGI